MLHTFWVGNLRLLLDAVLTSGKQHSSGHAKAALERLLDELGEQAPALLGGDCGYGNEDIINVCEQRGVRYLLRLRKTRQRQTVDRAIVPARALDARHRSEPGLAGH
ncbi:MAG: transposase [Vibrio fluvialis]